MTARQYLEQYKEANRKIKRCREELENETLLVDAVRSLSDNDGMPHGSGISKPTEDKAIRLADKRMRLADAMVEAIRIRQDVFDTIMLVGGLEADVLVERYINLRTWEDVCKAVNYSWFPVRDAWHRGEAKIEDILKTRTYI